MNLTNGLSTGPGRILMVAGGTGGHIFPALAVAEELRRRAPYEIEFLGTHRPLEAKLIPAAGFRLRTVDAAGLKGIGGLKRLRNLLVLPRTAWAVAGILREFKPHVVVGVGGYLAGPVMLEAALVNIPTVLIEPNARPGFTNRLLAPVVRAAAVGFAETAGLYGEKAHLTGIPVRRTFFDIPPRDSAARPLVPVDVTQPLPAVEVTQPLLAVSNPAQAGVPVPPFTILVVGGSQGSRAINQVVAASVPMLVGLPPAPAGAVEPALRPAPGGDAAAVDVGASSVGPGPIQVRPDANAGLKHGSTAALPGIRIIHQTGEPDYNEIRKSYHGYGSIVEVHPFIDDMPGTLAQADLVISRAGATTVAELAAAGRAALLIPFPGATDQHQLENARAMEEAGAARVIVQSELTPQRWVEEVRSLMANPETVAKMGAAARRLARPDAAARIADLVERLVGRG